MDRKTYPLPDTFFRVPELTDAERAHYLHVGDTALHEFLNKVLGPDNPTLVWRPFGEVQGVKIVEADAPGFKVDKNLLPCRMTAQICGSIDEVAMLHASDTRHHCAEYVDQYSGDILDVIPLYNLVPRGSDGQYKQCYLKWSAHLSPVVIIRDRDYVYVESQDLITLPSGQRAWAYCRTSVDVLGIPNLERTHLKLVRGHFHHVGAVFIESATPGVLDVIAQVAVDAKGSIPQWVRKLGMKNNVRQITLVEDYVQKLRMSSRISKCSTSVVSTSSSSQAPPPTHPPSSSPFKRCTLCQSPSSPFKKFKACDSCGDLICSKCSSVWNVNVPSKPRVRVCHTCAHDVQRGAVWEIHDMASDGTATSSSRETIVDAILSQRSSTVQVQRKPSVHHPVIELPTDTITMSSLTLQDLQKEAASRDDGDVDLSYLSAYSKKAKPQVSLAEALDSVVFPTSFHEEDGDVTCSTLESVQSAHDPVRDSILEAFLNQLGQVHAASQRDSFADRRSLVR